MKVSLTILSLSPTHSEEILRRQINMGIGRDSNEDPQRLASPQTISGKSLPINTPQSDPG